MRKPSPAEGVSKCATAWKPEAGPPLPAQLRQKGWSIRDAADYLGVSRQRLYSVFADPCRARLWECAVAGIPACTAEMAQALKEARRARPRPVSRAKPAEPPAFEIGDGVIAVDYTGIAEEGEEGWIGGIRGAKDRLELLVRMPRGEDWFGLADFGEVFMTNGKTRQGG